MQRPTAPDPMLEPSTSVRPDQQAPRENGARIVRELEDTKRLQEFSALLINDERGDEPYELILDTAMAIMRSDCASIQKVSVRSSHVGAVSRGGRAVWREAMGA